tara:strand:- start:6723 stop:6986 length:264 start_codon:yes stop_codon:yes gene_type:complete
MKDDIRDSLRQKIAVNQNSQSLSDIIQGRVMFTMVTDLGMVELRTLYIAHRIRFILMDEHEDTYDAIIFRPQGEADAIKMAKNYKKT